MATPSLSRTHSPRLTQMNKVHTTQTYTLMIRFLRLLLEVALSQGALLNGERVESGLLSPQTDQFSVQLALTLEI